MSRRTRKLVLVLLWATLGLSGIGLLQRYASAAGDSGSPVATWPAAATKLPRDGATLVMFVHPKCVCSRASVAELSRLVTRSSYQLHPIVVFTRPDGMTGDLTDSILYRQATKIRGATVVMDDSGTEARIFGAETSGHVFLFDAAGTRVFSGGITGARGHEGDNVGADAVLTSFTQQGSAQRSQIASRPTSPIFGCGLFSRLLAAASPTR